MHVNVQNSTSNGRPRRDSGVSGSVLSHPVAPRSDGSSPSTGSWSVVAISGKRWRAAPWVAPVTSLVGDPGRPGARPPRPRANASGRASPVVYDHQMAPTRAPDLLGRTSEREQLDRLLANVRGGQSAVLVIRGEAGIGKTALLRYAARQAASGFRVSQLAGVEAEMELPFAGVHQLCAPMLARL